MPSDTPYTRIFRRATKALGGTERLAHALGVPVEQIEAWATGLEDPPPHVFMMAIDLVSHFELSAGPVKL